MRYLAIILLFASLSLGAFQDLNGDGIINLEDTAKLAAGYGTTYGIDDVINQAEYWLVYDVGPVPSDAAASTTQYVRKEISFTATRAGDAIEPDTVYITAIPAGVQLIDPAPWAGAINSGMLPYPLSETRKSCLIVAEDTGVKNIKFKVIHQGVMSSAEGTIAVTVSAHPGDCLVFDGAGYASIADDPDNTFDLADEVGISFYIKTRMAYGPLLRKYGGSGNGYEISIHAGCLQVKLYKGGDCVFTGLSGITINTGNWVNCGIAYDDSAADNYFDMCTNCFASDGRMSGSWSNTSLGLPDGGFANIEPLIIADGRGFAGEIDKICVYTGVFLDALNIGWIAANLDGRLSAVPGGLSQAPSKLFMFSEGSGTTSQDESATLTATINNGSFVPGKADTRLFSDGDTDLRRSKDNNFVNYSGEKIPVHRDPFRAKLGKSRF